MSAASAMTAVPVTFTGACASCVIEVTMLALPMALDRVHDPTLLVIHSPAFLRPRSRALDRYSEIPMPLLRQEV